jgi:hypothetical protein
MNCYTKDIMRQLACDLDHALLVQAELMLAGFDFSEATEEEFTQVVAVTDEIIKEKSCETNQS